MAFLQTRAGRLAGVLTALLVALALIQPASAISGEQYQSDLEDAGFTVEAESAAVDFPALSIDGQAFVVTKPEGKARVVLLSYGSRADLEKDWTVASGKEPVARAETDAFDGMALYWNNDSVLVVDYGGDNNRLAAVAASSVFLGQIGTGGVEPTPGAPATGSGLANNHGSASGYPLMLAGLGVLVTALGVAALSIRRAR